MKYEDEYRNQILQKLLRPGGPSVMEVSSETGIHHATLYKWMREQKNGHMNRSGNGKSPRRWSLREKLSALLEAREKPEGDLGLWLRAKGLHGDHLERFEKEIEGALAKAERPDRSAVMENKALKKDLDRKDKTIAEMSALLVLKKKFQTLMDS